MIFLGEKIIELAYVTNHSKQTRIIEKSINKKLSLTLTVLHTKYICACVCIPIADTDRLFPIPQDTINRDK